MTIQIREQRWPYVLGGALVVLAVAAAFLYPRCARCITYGSVVSLQGARESLASQPKDVTISYAGGEAPLSTGYAETALPEDWARSITRMNGAICIVSGEGEEESVTFMRPFFDVQFSADGNYTYEVATARVEEVALRDVFTMSTAEFKRLMYYTVPKATNSFNQNGIGLFETEHVRGIIQHGAFEEPGRIRVHVWSRQGQVSQGILVAAGTAERASELVQCVLSNLEYSIKYLPAADELQGLIRDTIEAHELYTADPDAEDVP